MTSLPLLTITIFLPLLGALVILLSGESRGSHNARWVGLWVSFVTWLLSIVLWGRFDPTLSGFQLEDVARWMPSLGLSYHVGVDGISLPFILLTTLIVPLCIMASWTSIQIKVRAYIVAFLVLETLLLGSFAALDFVLFYLFFEGVLLPMFFIIGIWGGGGRIEATFKFFLYTFLGSSLMLLALVYLYLEIGGGSIPLALAATFDPKIQKWLWLAFFASFAIKLPMWPFHTWLPDAHVEAPTGGSMMLAGVLLKMGGYGFLRFSLPLFPEASAYFAPLVFALSVIAIVYGSFVALAQTDMKKLIAYSSVAHMGFVTLGIFTRDMAGIQGAIMQMVSHGLISTALFLCVGVVYDRAHTREIAHYGALVHRMPRYAVVFIMVILASLGLPGTSGFVGEFLVLLGTFHVNIYAAGVAAFSMILAPAYGLWLYQRMMFGPPSGRVMADLNGREILVFFPLLGGILFLGLYPTPFFKLMEGTLNHSPPSVLIQRQPEP